MILKKLFSLRKGSAPSALVSPRQAHLALSSLALSSGPCLLIDVRSREEFEAGHASGAVCIPLHDLPLHVADIPRDRPVYLCCAAGRRSAAAAQQLKGMGYDNAIDIAGGFNAWRAAGLPVAESK